MQAYVCSIGMYYTRQYKNIFYVFLWNMNDYTNVFVSCLLSEKNKSQEK